MQPLRVLGTGSSAWKVRRRIVISTILWCAALISWILIFAMSDSLRETGVLALAGLMSATIGSYVFGAVWDDNSIRETGVASQAVDQGIPSNQTVLQQPVNIQQGNQPNQDPPPGFAG